MQWKTEKQERKKRKWRGLARTLGAVTAIGSSLGLGSLINTDTTDISQLNAQITQLNKEIKDEEKKTKDAEKETQDYKSVNINNYSSECKRIVKSSKK